MAGLCALVYAGPLAGQAGVAATWVNDLGAWAYLIAPIAMIVVAILPVPAEIPAAANGLVFGPVVGTVITWSGAVAGAMMSFELSRRFGRPMGERYAGAERMRRADDLVASAGWTGLLVLRLIPAVAFTAINWAAGLTTISRKTFFWTTAVGILPGAILFTWSGSGLAALYRMNPYATMGMVVAVALVTWVTWLRYRTRVRTRTP